jgi:hypothetical protein
MSVIKKKDLKQKRMVIVLLKESCNTDLQRHKRSEHRKTLGFVCAAHTMGN